MRFLLVLLSQKGLRTGFSGPMHFQRMQPQQMSNEWNGLGDVLQWHSGDN